MIDTDFYNANILGYVSATGDGSTSNLSNSSDISAFESNDSTDSINKKAFSSSLNHVEYLPPFRKLDGGNGALAIDPIFDKFLVKWQNQEFLIYLVDARDGTAPWFQKRQFVLTSDTSAAFTLIKTAGSWQNTLHGEIWVFDQGFWQKDAGLWQSIQKSNWADIILPSDLKEDLLNTVQRFYDSRDTYKQLHVPWKRGLIFYGPPGNGKTVSIKATMKTLYDRADPVSTLYVKSLVSWAGPEYSISQIFAQARREAPCYLVFEDLDSLVTDQVRSFFLNAVDGLSQNEGILMVGSTNHLDKLDPGIAKRPSRFDRKYLFPNPDLEQRTRYCELWQRKLKDNKDIDYPDSLLKPIAKLMDGFSFAYMQEAFISTLLKLATDMEKVRRIEDLRKEISRWDLTDLEEEPVVIGVVNDDLEKYVLWREIKIQIANLKKELDRGTE